MELLKKKKLKDVLRDRKYNIPVMDPLYIKELKIENSGTEATSLNIITHDLYLLDLKAKNLEIDLSLPTFFIKFKYEINGKILVLPIKGNGDATLNFTNTNIQMHLDYDFVKKGDEKVYASVTGNKLDFNIGNIVIYLDNLFNGDKALGDNTNMFLNENWEVLAKDLGPFIAEGIAAAIKQIAAGLMDKVPYDDLLPENV
uniref:Uncharacterized protein n=1 Tax=Timema tahoe TaxID=61484 RepID=A0A7R9NZC8_9NEOP|nr:unnamed protein product [Timema tahoe]